MRVFQVKKTHYQQRSNSGLLVHHKFRNLEYRVPPFEALGLDCGSICSRG